MASQNVTIPGETGEPPAITVAVDVTGVPLATELEDNVRVVVVDWVSADALVLGAASLLDLVLRELWMAAVCPSVLNTLVSKAEHIQRRERIRPLNSKENWGS